MESFLSKDAAPMRTLADVIVAKIKEQDTTVSSGLTISFVASFDSITCLVQLDLHSFVSHLMCEFVSQSQVLMPIFFNSRSSAFA